MRANRFDRSTYVRLVAFILTATAILFLSAQISGATTQPSSTPNPIASSFTASPASLTSAGGNVN